MPSSVLSAICVKSIKKFFYRNNAICSNMYGTRDSYTEHLILDT